MDEGKQGRMLKGNGEYYETVIWWTLIIRRKRRWKSYFLSISRLFFLSMPVTACQPAGTVPACSRGVPEAIKAVGIELSKSKTEGLTSKDLSLITICLLGQSQEEVPGQRLPAILWWHLFSGSKGTGRNMAHCQANITHTFVNRNLHTVSRTFRMPWMFLAMASPQGRNQRPKKMAPCQTQTGRHSQAPSEAVREPSKRRRKIVAVGWNHSDKCNCGGSMEKKKKFRDANSCLLCASCGAGRKLLPITKS